MDGWRVELLGWENLPKTVQSSFVRMVGEWSGEWWGEGRAEFYSSVMARGCAREVSSELRLTTRVSLWVRNAPPQ